MGEFVGAALRGRPSREFSTDGRPRSAAPTKNTEITNDESGIY